MTELKRELKMNSVSNSVNFLIAVINNEIYADDNIKVTVEELYERYKRWNEENGIKDDISKVWFSRDISKIIEGIKWWDKTHNYRGYRINKGEIRNKIEEHLKMKIEEMI